jgi:hypothetical protein
MTPPKKIHETIHYLDILLANSSPYQPEIRKALEHALIILNKLDTTITLEQLLKEVLKE